MALTGTEFDFLTLEEVLAIKARASALLAEGKTIMSTSGDGKGSSKQFSASPMEILLACNARLRQLNYGGATVVRRVINNYSRNRGRGYNGRENY